MLAKAIRVDLRFIHKKKKVALDLIKLYHRYIQVFTECLHNESSLHRAKNNLRFNCIIIYV